MFVCIVLLSIQREERYWVAVQSVPLYFILVILSNVKEKLLPNFGVWHSLIISLKVPWGKHCVGSHSFYVICHLNEWVSTAKYVFSSVTSCMLFEGIFHCINCPFSDLLLLPIKSSRLLYFRTRLEELRMFLENETWELCPVKSNFSILQLHVSSLNNTYESVDTAVSKSEK